MHNFILIVLVATVALVHSTHRISIASDDQLLTRVVRGSGKSSEEKNSKEKDFAVKVESNEDEEGSGQKAHRAKTIKDSSSSEEKQSKKANADSEVEGSGDLVTSPVIRMARNAADSSEESSGAILVRSDRSAEGSGEEVTNLDVNE